MPHKEPDFEKPNLCYQGRLHRVVGPFTTVGHQVYSCGRCGKVKITVKNLRLDATWEHGLSYCVKSVKDS